MDDANTKVKSHLHSKRDGKDRWRTGSRFEEYMGFTPDQCELPNCPDRDKKVESNG